jgi:hypothetical protein
VARDPALHHAVPHYLLSLHEKANGSSLDGEGIQAWLEWEMEALRWRVPAEISKEDLEELVGPLKSPRRWGRITSQDLEAAGVLR